MSEKHKLVDADGSIWYVCPSCREKHGRLRKLFKVIKSGSSEIEVKCKNCGEIITILV